MNNLHRELAPISDKAWAQIEEEASRTLKRHLAARRVVDVRARRVSSFSAVGTGHLQQIRRLAMGSRPRNARRKRSSNCAFRSSSRARRLTTWSAAQPIRTGRR